MRIYAPIWLYILVSIPCICIVGFVIVRSLSGLHSLVISVRFRAMMGG